MMAAETRHSLHGGDDSAGYVLLKEGLEDAGKDALARELRDVELGSFLRRRPDRCISHEIVCSEKVRLWSVRKSRVWW